MLSKVHLDRRRRLAAAIGVSVLLVSALAVVISCTESPADTGTGNDRAVESQGEQSTPTGTPPLMGRAAAKAHATASTANAEDAPVVATPVVVTIVTGSPWMRYQGSSSLEERIAESDLIVKARLRSVSSATELWDGNQDGSAGHVGALEFTFDVLEYLKGSGGTEVVAVVHLDQEYATSQGADEEGKRLRAEHDTRWDGREAIVFLRNDPSLLPSSRRENRSLLGLVFAGEGTYIATGVPCQETVLTSCVIAEDDYTIASRHNKRWLPAAAGESGAAGTSDTQRFLLDEPPDASGGGVSGQAGTAPTITLAEMKAKIAEIERQAVAGGGSEEYRDCLYHKYKWEREVRYRKESLGGVYYYKRYDEATASGRPAGTRVYTAPTAGFLLSEYGETEPPNSGESRLVGRDKDLFSTRWPANVYTVRPLPTGEYKFYYGERPQVAIICDAHPEDELKRIEVFVTVTAPAGTVHEAFFDPAAIGTAVGADGTNGVLKPTAFTVGGVSTGSRA